MSPIGTTHQTSARDAPAFDGVRDQLTFTRTVDRTLLHRSALSEVFLTDVRPVDRDRFVAAAQLPSSHAYYTSHRTQARLHDPLLLLECCRQAETYAAHAFFGVAADTHFALQRWAMDLPGLPEAPATGLPAELVIGVNTEGGRHYDGQLRELTYVMDLSIGSAALGRVEMVVCYVPAAMYPLLRSGHRGTPPPSSDATPLPDGLPVEPGLVARDRPEDVVLLDPQVGANSVSATLRPPTGHPSMFDHAQDHIPGMVLSEAARQVSLLAAHHHSGPPSDRSAVTVLAASFSAYAELDSPVTVTAHVHSGGPSRQDMRVRFRQHDLPIAQAAVTMVDSQHRCPAPRPAEDTADVRS